MTDTAVQPSINVPTVGQTPTECAFSLFFSGKYDEGEKDAAGPTLSMAITEILPAIARGVAHSRAVFGARRIPESGRSYGSLEVEFPGEDERPTDGYREWGVRRSLSFDDEIEIFDATEELDTAEAALRYRAQELGDDEKSLATIQDGVQRYVEAFDNLLLWDPKASLDIEKGLDDLFEDRDWTPFISRAELQVPDVSISNVTLVPHEDAWLLKFEYVNGSESGTEMEYVYKKKGRMYVARSSYSASRAAIPAFSGRQLSKVYDALQEALDGIAAGALTHG
ncbi:hypothetical protein [Rhizobium indigoferae]|uniref:DUF2303 family protein n=1 Tax=Rhizobium indigoferae TaxID=158891 RepID=A0ABZ0ZGC7_9HYPH|nr:hypothetical protein [Rhizobium indigoferae]NNU56221.1 hypothetical protein [Rhizobium indigoferae]WQN37660.1 hypothetical protein U5G49_002794 [Rhizobium indigoferae]GLR59249.1 hypothetical protein GCM10007919_39760 [Rhizobium indigoferae]